MECCGQERSSKFCPDCGRAIDADPLRQLRQHVQSTLQTKTASLATKERKNDGGQYDLKWIAIGKRTVAKWTRWLEALDKVIENQ